ncbi:DEAD/DEAH box helicase [Hyphomicrobium sulfonivorans]|uniref:DEAD/DEAH box helicase n=1 Tax=Hyphomicrobium sulfonivorans TaxID=121290 RepID=UPI000837C7A4
MKDNILTTQNTETTTPAFSQLGLNPVLLKALDAEGYVRPTPIQSQAIPGVMAGRDLMGIAQTGTGKTAAFALPILHRLLEQPRAPQRGGARALILSPTRELATQIADSFRAYGKHTGLTVTVMFGGMPIRPQVSAMSKGVDILVATPGRLLDHVDQRTVNLSGTEILVLDEADQMLDMGFIAPIRKILSKLSQRRQSLFFSATMPREINALASEMLTDPLRVAVAAVSKTADRVAQSVIHVEQQKKQSLLAELFRDENMKRTIVFTRTKRGADRVARHLETAGVQVAAIHGNKSQRQREVALEQFRKGRIRALIATDIAARGIDIDEVSHVVNYELPNIPESYVHRIGRTARAGAEGIAISLCAGDERAYLRDIEKLTRQQIPATDRTGDTTLEAVSVSAAARRGGDRNQPRNGGRRGDGDRNGSRDGSGARKPQRSGASGAANGNGLAARSQKPRGEAVAARGERQGDDRRQASNGGNNGAGGAGRRQENRGSGNGRRAEGFGNPDARPARNDGGPSRRSGAARPSGNRQGGRGQNGRSMEGRGSDRSGSSARH